LPPTSPRPESPAIGTPSASIHKLPEPPSSKAPEPVRSSLAKGAEIGPAQNFAGGNRGFLATYGPYGGGTYNHHDGLKFGQAVYVGFKFEIAGQPHFGWARVQVRFNPNFHKHKLSLRLLGYAYETTANQPIQAGQTSKPVSVKDSRVESHPGSAPQQSLGVMALGADGIAMWRK
jgi:hypothetical protein